MKFKITRPDGTIIEGEGTADDVLRLAPIPFVWNPSVYVPFVWNPSVYVPFVQSTEVPPLPPNVTFSVTPTGPG